MNKITLIVFIFGILAHMSVYSQESSFYYPWNNRVSSLNNNLDDTTVPLLSNGESFRILKIENFQGHNISDISVFSKLTQIEVSYLPVIKDYKNRKILDLILPMNRPFKFQNTESTKYFLIKFKGKKPGKETVRLDIRTDKKEYSIYKDVFVSKTFFENDLHLNVWAYFDYNFLIKDMKAKVINDLFNHNADVLVIPPGYIPLIGNIEKERILKLKEYLEGTKGKFTYYALYMGYTNNSKYIMSKLWKEAATVWYRTILTVFNDLEIPHSKLLFYPYDEPKGESVKTIIEMYDWFKKEKIAIPFFATIGNKEALELSRKLEIVQIYSGNTKLIEEVKHFKNPQTQIWIYEIPAGSRNIEAYLYQRIGIKAFSVNATGIGIWNYSDVRLAFDEASINNFQRGKGSWEISSKESSRDYSLIYRKNDIIYSSLRWEALAYGMHDNFFIEMYARRYGADRANILVNNLLSNKMSPRDWETVKISLSNGN